MSGMTLWLENSWICALDVSVYVCVHTAVHLRTHLSRTKTFCGRWSHCGWFWLWEEVVLQLAVWFRVRVQCGFGVWEWMLSREGASHRMQCKCVWAGVCMNYRSDTCVFSKSKVFSWERRLSTVLTLHLPQGNYLTILVGDVFGFRDHFI